MCAHQVMRKPLDRALTGAAAALLLLAGAAPAAEPDWERVTVEASELLSTYIRIDTANPPGRTVEAVGFLRDQLAAAGIAVEVIGASPEKPMLIGRLKGSGGAGGKPIVLLNHMDVVPAGAAPWSFPPFSGAIRDGVIYGRGALDMKGFAVAQLMALRLLAQRSERPRHDLVFLAVADEEVGGIEGTAWLAEQRPDLLDAAGVWDEGSFGLTDALPVPVVLISVTEKQLLWLRLVAEGPSGHGSRPFPGAAPRRLVEAIDRLLEKPAAPRLTPIVGTLFRKVGRSLGGFEGLALRNLGNPVVWLFADGVLQQEPWAAAITRDTMALTVLNAGYKPNVIPERAEAVLDCRLLPDTQPQAFIEQLRKVIDDPEVRIEVLQEAQPAPPSPTDNALFAAMRHAIVANYPGVVVAPSMTIGATDSRFFRRRGVPAYGLYPILIDKDLAATVHGIDERLPAADLGKAVRVVYEALRNL